MRKLTSVVELTSFITDTDGVLNDDERESLKVFLAANPTTGVLVKGTGGVRKLRWAASGRGKRGGGRVIYYYHSEEMPLYLFKFFTKARKADLTAAEKRELAGVIAAIVAEHNRK